MLVYACRRTHILRINMGFGDDMNYTEKDRVWSVKYAGGTEDDSAVRELARALGVSEVCARLIYNRGYTDAEDARAFLHPDISILHDPYLLNDMQAAVERIAEAIRCGERITIYGDYDVDGVTSVSLAYLYLKSQGAVVDYYIPSRTKEGYGVCSSAIDKLCDRGTGLIITVDTGITANTEIEYAKGLGIDTVVTDHHECHAELPRAVAVINPHRHDSTYPFTYLAGVGVVFKLICAYEMYTHPQMSAQECARVICDGYIDLVAIGTVADVMPLLDENRFIVDIGIKKISETDRVGLCALIEGASQSSRPAVGGKARPQKRKINTGFIGFTLAPRINAAGRISSATKAVDLLLCEDHDEAATRAQELCDINACRQVEENRIAEQAYKMIEQSHDFKHDRVIVLDNDSWQQGIIGIVSSRITEKYGLPSILISYEGATRGFESPDDIGKGSGRSIKGLNLVDALSYCDDILVRFGGHELAAGLSVRRGDVDEFRKKINEYAAQRLSDEDTRVVCEADCELRVADISMELAEEIECLEPFGVSNATPVFMMRDLEVDRISPLGAGNHCKLFFGKEARSINAVMFGTAASELDFYRGEHVDILCRLSINEFRGERTVQLILSDIRMSERLEERMRADKARFAEVMGGAGFYADENILPSRDDVALVYKILRAGANHGRSVMSGRALMSAVGEYTSNVGYVKLGFIICIIRDMGVIKICPESENLFSFEIVKDAKKTSVESSETYQMLLRGCMG